MADKITHVWTNKGEPILRDRTYTLGFMAQEHGPRENGATMKVDAFKDLLASLGVSDPIGTAWEVTLPNGHVVGHSFEGAPKANGRKAPAKKAPASRKASLVMTEKGTTLVPAKAPAKKAPAKKAPKSEPVAASRSRRTATARVR